MKIKPELIKTINNSLKNLLLRVKKLVESIQQSKQHLLIVA